MKDIKSVVDAAKAAGATVVTDCKVTNVSFFVARTDTVDYWATLTLNQELPGMIAKGEGQNVTYTKGLTKTVTVPIGTTVTLLFDYLIEQDDDDALDLCDYKKLVFADAEKEARADDNSPYVSYLHRLLMRTIVNVIARNVEKGKKVKSLFALNDKETIANNDSIWHDIYGLTNVRAKTIAEALAYCVDANAKNAAPQPSNDVSAYNALMANLKQNAAVDAVKSALG